MANPQLENGYTKIANEILEALGKFNATSSQFRVLMILLRNIYGYSEKGRRVATSMIIKDTGMNKSQCIRTINELLVAKIITRSPCGNPKGHKYWIQKDYDRWQKPIRMCKKGAKKVAKGRPKGCQGATFSDVTPYIKEKRVKEQTNKGGNNSELPDLKNLKRKYPWLDILSWNEFREHRLNLFKKTKRHPFNALAETKALNQLKLFIDLGYKQFEILDPSIISGWAGIFKPKEEPTRELGDF